MFVDAIAACRYERELLSIRGKRRLIVKSRIIREPLDPGTIRMHAVNIEQTNRCVRR